MSEVWEDYLAHIGVKYRSGRYPYGSGEDPYQHDDSWLRRYHGYRQQGYNDTEIARFFEMTTRQLKDKRAAELQAQSNYQNQRWQALYEKGMSYSEISELDGYPTSTIASRLKGLQAAKESVAQKRQNAITIIKETMTEGGYLDLGHGTAEQLNISDSMLKSAIKSLEAEGYVSAKISIPQQTRPHQQFNTIVLISPEEAQKMDPNKDPVKQAQHLAYKARDNGELMFYDGKATIDKDTGEIRKIQYPQSIDSKRIDIRYAEDGGLLQDGTIELRRNVPDLSLGNAHYAQVRILVDGDHYLKGMAHYSDDLPDGVDIRFNTNKSKGTPALGPDNDHSVLKCIDPKLKDNINPFGAYYDAKGQSEYEGPDGQRHLSAINKLRKEGDWEDQRVRVPSQMLSKQPKETIQKQLKETLKDYQAEYDEIMSNTNPVIKQKLLNDFADKCEKASADLHAKAFPRQRTQVILPIVDIPDNQIFAPNFKNGEKVALIRYPHEATSQIPILTVNNKNKEGLRVYGADAMDMVGINAKVASRMSGADFDGDTVSVIPTGGSVNIKNSKQLEGLKDYDPHTQYAGYPGMKRLPKKQTGKEMGIISNLITDMTVKGADLDEIEKAIKHSMVIIDASKHNLDYKRSEIENDIPALKKKYQGHVDPFTGEYKESGASTLISLAKNPTYVDERKGSGHVDKETGVKTFDLSGRMITDYKTGKQTKAQQEIYKMYLVDDARKLSTGTEKEELYANYANAMKAMTNKCRKEAINMQLPKKDKQAEQAYAYEVASLDAKLKSAIASQTKERHAHAIAGSVTKAIIEEYPDQYKGKENKKERKKLEQTQLELARARVGAKSGRFTLTDKEYEAIQAHAISSNKVKQLLNYVDKDDFAAHTRPAVSNTLSTAQQTRMKALARSGYTTEEIADSLRVSVSTVLKYTQDVRKDGGAE